MNMYIVYTIHRNVVCGLHHLDLFAMSRRNIWLLSTLDGRRTSDSPCQIEWIGQIRFVAFTRAEFAKKRKKKRRATAHSIKSGDNVDDADEDDGEQKYLKWYRLFSDVCAQTYTRGKPVWLLKNSMCEAQVRTFLSNG